MANIYKEKYQICKWQVRYTLDRYDVKHPKTTFVLRGSKVDDKEALKTALFKAAKGDVLMMKRDLTKGNFYSIPVDGNKALVVTMSSSFVVEIPYKVLHHQRLGERNFLLAVESFVLNSIDGSVTIPKVRNKGIIASVSLKREYNKTSVICRVYYTYKMYSL